MSYECSFKPTEEAIAKIKPWNYGKDNYSKDNSAIDDCKLEILVYCMDNHDVNDISNILKNLRYKMRYMEISCYEDYKRSIYEEWLKNGEITFCGWKYSHDEPDLEREEVYTMYLESLGLLASVVKTPDYFNDGEKFFTKKRHIKDVMEGFLESMYEIFAFQIMDMFKEFRIPECDFEDYGDEIPESVSVSENEGDK